MTFRDPSKTMWMQALKLLDQADRLQSQFFQLRKSQHSGPMWEPPIDIYETAQDLHICIALPGVDPNDIQIVIDPEGLAVIGERPLAADNTAVIRQMEIPFGRFERRINMKGKAFEIVENTLTNGCLSLVLKKL